jgi:prepilin-type processing-associated H-X9-DG protein
MVFTLVVALALFIPSVSANDGDDIQVEKTQLTYPNLSTHLNGLAVGYGSGQMSQREAAGVAPVHSGGSVAVTVYLDGHVAEVVSFLEDNGGDPRNVGSDYIEAYVPVSLLGSLSQQPGVVRVREIIPPEPLYGNVTS